MEDFYTDTRFPDIVLRFTDLPKEAQDRVIELTEGMDIERKALFMDNMNKCALWDKYKERLSEK